MTHAEEIKRMTKETRGRIKSLEKTIARREEEVEESKKGFFTKQPFIAKTEELRETVVHLWQKLSDLEMLARDVFILSDEEVKKAITRIRGYDI